MSQPIVRPPIEFRAIISIRPDVTPELWEVFDSIPKSRRSSVVMLMLARLASMEKAKGSSLAFVPATIVATPVVPDRTETQPDAPLPPKAQDAASANEGAQLLESFGADGLNTFLNYENA